MSTQGEPQSPRPIEPLLDAVTDAVASGYQSLEHVIEGLRESLRLNAGARSGPGRCARLARPRGSSLAAARRRRGWSGPAPRIAPGSRRTWPDW